MCLALQILLGLVRKFGNSDLQFCDPYDFVLTPWTLACKADSMDEAIFLLCPSDFFAKNVENIAVCEGILWGSCLANTIRNPNVLSFTRLYP